MSTRSLFLPFLFLIAGALCGTLAACGGGGSGGASSAATGAAASPATASGAPSTPGTPGSAASSPAAIPQSSTPNVQPIAVTTAPGLTRNMLTTSVTVCVPGTSNCATIDNVQVDTGSQGLRLLASALPSTLQLPALQAGGGNAGECAVFGGGYTWGAVRSADVRMAGQLAAALPVQVIADPTVPTVPSDCSGAGVAMQSTASLRSNGILGVGLFAADCGSTCADNATPRWYYSCDTSGACQASVQAVAQQVTNPVSAFALDNNGVVIDLPAIGAGGAPSVSGSLIFGIGTQANNVLGEATVLRANTQNGYVTTVSNSQTYSLSYLDSGSNALFIADAGMPECGLWYCPATQQTESATISGSDGATATVSYSVDNATALFNSSDNAFNDLAGISSNSFGWGLPFFYGRRIYTAIEARLTSAGAGPYYAF
ncbi:MAG: DUF3443 domain-containing protein [Pseudomonadota bacterium]|uniref:DUF3443 domain-containing protein n=3 Tax=Burkholderiaceae TaxID=119060 RepID=UPI0010F8D90D|nr:DUF3443 domain-containing protein [Burkholderia sp. 4M9327F10]